MWTLGLVELQVKFGLSLLELGFVVGAKRLNNETNWELSLPDGEFLAAKRVGGSGRTEKVRTLSLGILTFDFDDERVKSKEE